MTKEWTERNFYIRKEKEIMNQMTNIQIEILTELVCGYYFVFVRQGNQINEIPAKLKNKKDK